MNTSRTWRPPRGFGRTMRAFERVQTWLTPNDWPARFVERLGGLAPLQVVSHDIHVRVRARALPPLRVAFASDLHAGPYTASRVLTHATQALATSTPDVLLLGGDFVTLEARYIDRIAGQLGEIAAPGGRFAVLGNHDHWSGTRVVVEALERAGIQVLVNESVRLPPPFEAVRVCGLDDHLSGYPDADAALGEDAHDVRLVLMHQPSGLLDLGARDFALALAGHTHGGQIALPGGWPPHVPPGPLSRQYHAGHFTLRDGRQLLVSRGVGQSTVPLRWNAPPEVHVITLQAAAPVSADGTA